MSQGSSSKDLLLMDTSKGELEGDCLIKKKSRRGTKKSRLGCVTCKIRRIKCDEERPSCFNCTKTGRKCDQYDGKDNSIIKSTLWDKLNPIRATRISTNNVYDLTSCSTEITYLDLFQSISNTLSGISDIQFWREDVLRNLSERPATTSAAIAFGAYYKTLQIDEKRVGDDLDALKLYQKSIKNVNSELSKVCAEGYLENSLQDIMIATVLLVCVDLLRHEHVKAHTHLHGGLLLFSNYFTAIQDRNLCPSSLSIRKVFQKLEWQACLYIGSRTIHYPETLLTDLPTLTFSNLSEASEALDSIALSTEILYTPPYSEKYYKEKIDPFFTKVGEELGGVNYNVFHGTMYRDFPVEPPQWQRTKFQNKLEAWKQMFTLLCLNRTNMETSQDDLTNIARLWMLYNVTYIKLCTFYSGKEVDYDKHLSNFQAIVDQAEMVSRADFNASLSLSTPHRLPPLHPKNGFILHMGISYPLYFTALKCRERSLRLRAISLLGKTKSEGVWVTPILTGIARFFMHDEETSAANDHTASDIQRDFGIPEVHRAHCFIVNVDASSKKVKLKYNKAITELHNLDDGRTWKIYSRSFSWE